MNHSARLLPLLLAAGVFAGCRGSAPDDLIGGEDSTEMLVFVRASSEESLNRTNSTSNLYILAPISPDGTVRPLTNFPSGSVYDPCVSFDGKKVLFSMSPEPGQPRNIWEINVDGTGLRKVTGAVAGRDGEDYDPLYLPDGRIAFTSNRPGHLDEYNRSLAEVLHTCNADGSDLRQVSFNMSDDFDPFLLPTGMIGYTRWDHHGTTNRFPMFSTRPDGSGTFHMFGSHNLNFFHVNNVPDGRLISVISDEVNGDAGRLALCRLEDTRGDPMKPGQIAYLTPEIELSPPFTLGAYKYPTSLGDNTFVVSFSLPYGSEVEESMNEEDADFGLYTFDVIPGGPDGETISNLTFLYNDPTTQEYDAQLVAPHDRPQVIPSELNLSSNTGVFAVGSIYNRQTGDGQERPPVGAVTEVMVIEAIPTMPGDGMGISLTEFERKRIIGIAPVEVDGSFKVEVPANTPISFNVLDPTGRSFVTKRNWIYARPGESFTKCAGCHDDRGREANENTLAMARAATLLNPPVGSREVINFRDQLQSVVEAKCMGCHQPTFTTVWRDSMMVVDTLAAAGNLDLRMDAVTDTVHNIDYPRAYATLVGGMGEVDVEAPGVLDPGFSRRSTLIDWIRGLGSRVGQPAHPEGANALTAEEQRKFTVWVDLGAQYR